MVGAHRMRPIELLGVPSTRPSASGRDDEFLSPSRVAVSEQRPTVIDRRQDTADREGTTLRGLDVHERPLIERERDDVPRSAGCSDAEGCPQEGPVSASGSRPPLDANRTTIWSEDHGYVPQVRTAASGQAEMAVRRGLVQDLHRHRVVRRVRRSGHLLALGS